MSPRAVRVRFAPSPTGMFHVGSARTALFNWVVARQTAGAFVLRIEDSDASRSRPEWTDGIITALAWLGIAPGSYEGPFLQSENLAKQRAAAARLYEEGRAYYCDCTREAVLARTGDPNSGYDGYCRGRGLQLEPGRALRFRTPSVGTTVVVDLVKGEPSFENARLEDFVIARGDGSVLFLLANVVDDIDQGITHVIRGEDHLPNTPKQQMLWEALGHPPPVWAHLPMIVNQKRQKLSKRRDKVALEDYRDLGYLPEVMRTYLMLLGWTPPGGREVLPWDVIEAEFSLKDVNSGSAFFDDAKLRSLNGDYIRRLPLAEFIKVCQPWLAPPMAPWLPEAFDPHYFDEVAALAQTRISLLSEITSYVDFLFLDEPVFDRSTWEKTMYPAAERVLAASISQLATACWDAATLKATLEEIGGSLGMKLSVAQAPVRVAITGRTIGLPLFESLELLGRERTLSRLTAALSRAGSRVALAVDNDLMGRPEGRDIGPARPPTV